MCGLLVNPCHLPKPRRRGERSRTSAREASRRAIAAKPCVDDRRARLHRVGKMEIEPAPIPPPQAGNATESGARCERAASKALTPSNDVSKLDLGQIPLESARRHSPAGVRSAPRRASQLEAASVGCSAIKRPALTQRSKPPEEGHKLSARSAKGSHRSARLSSRKLRVPVRL